VTALRDFGLPTNLTCAVLKLGDRSGLCLRLAGVQCKVKLGFDIQLTGPGRSYHFLAPQEYIVRFGIKVDQIHLMCS
jgi:hypothetical protein